MNALGRTGVRFEPMGDPSPGPDLVVTRPLTGMADIRRFFRTNETPVYTLYTAVYRATEGWVEYRWPRSTWRQSFVSFVEGEHVEILQEADVVDPSLW